MAQSNKNAGPDFDLPDEILSVIPTDPYDQLDLARKITSMAIASRVSKLEADVAWTKQRLQDKDRVICELEDKVSYLERAYHDTALNLQTLSDENIKLTKERDSLATTVKRVGRDFAKLETFKRQLMRSLSDDNTQTETIDTWTSDQSVPRAYPDKEEETTGYFPHYSFNGSAEMGRTIHEASDHGGQRFPVTPYISPRFTRTGTPRISSTSVSPRAYSAFASPRRASGKTSPEKSHYEKRITLSSHYPSSQQPSLPNSPPRRRTHSGTPRIDGKEFFRQARCRLSYEQFSAFLASVKELNAQKQTREETLNKAEEIFGSENKDLYLLFQGLLNRNSH